MPDAVTVLYREEYMDLDYIELLEKCHNTQMSITEAECRATENKTHNQAETKVWFAQRAGQITTSKLKAACTTDISKPSKSLIKPINFIQLLLHGVASMRKEQDMCMQIKCLILMRSF